MKSETALILFGIVLIFLALVLVALPKIETSYIVNDEMAVVDKAQKKIDEGLHYFMRNYSEVGEGNYSIYFVDTCNIINRTHLYMEVSNSGSSVYNLREGVTIIYNGTELPYFNRNRFVSDDDCLHIYEYPQYVGGQLIASSNLWAGDIFGGDIAGRYELIFNENTNYVLEVVGGLQGENIINYLFDWYVNEGE